MNYLAWTFEISLIFDTVFISAEDSYIYCVLSVLRLPHRSANFPSRDNDHSRKQGPWRLWFCLPCSVLKPGTQIVPAHSSNKIFVGWMDGQVDRCMDWVDGYVATWMDEWLDGWLTLGIWWMRQPFAIFYSFGLQLQGIIRQIAKCPRMQSISE